MVRPGRDRLSGRVEVDETFLGGSEKGIRGRKTFKKALIVIAAEEDGKGIGRIRMRRVASASMENLCGFVRDVVEPGSTVHTDGWEGYMGLDRMGYVREITEPRNNVKSASELLPRVHRAISLMKRSQLN